MVNRVIDAIIRLTAPRWAGRMSAPAVLCLALSVGACSVFPERDTPPVLVPLEVGNRWVYLDATAFVVTGTITVRVERTVELHRRAGFLLSVVRKGLTGTVVSTDTVLAYHETGYNVHQTASEMSELAEYWRFPVEEGERFLAPQLGETCHATAEGVQVPAGTFEVLIYGACVDFDEDRTMFADGVGMVYSGNSGKRALFLSEYQVGSLD